MTSRGRFRKAIAQYSIAIELFIGWYIQSDSNVASQDEYQKQYKTKDQRHQGEQQKVDVRKIG